MLNFLEPMKFFANTFLENCRRGNSLDYLLHVLNVVLFRARFSRRNPGRVTTQNGPKNWITKNLSNLILLGINILLWKDINCKFFSINLQSTDMCFVCLCLNVYIRKDSLKWYKTIIKKNFIYLKMSWIFLSTHCYIFYSFSNFRENKILEQSF